MTAQTIIQEFAGVAAERGIEPALLLAVAELETNLRPFALVDARNEPLIRFEGHYFDRRLSPADRDRARQAGLSSPRAGAIANPAGQPARWALLGRAAAIDREAAFESTSWGMGQVMGAHWDWLGYTSVDALVTEARSGIAGQVRLMAAFIDRSGLSRALGNHDWQAFARGYNGPAFHRNAYDTRLKAAYLRHAGRVGGDEIRVLRTGAKGEDVRQLQTALGRHGLPLAADGLFGSATERSVRVFQQRSGLPETGIACTATLAAIDQSPPPQPGRRLPSIGLLGKWRAARKR